MANADILWNRFHGEKISKRTLLEFQMEPLPPAVWLEKLSVLRARITDNSLRCFQARRILAT
jgi:hypothetical protein